MTARPVGGDTREALREEIGRALFYKVTRRDGLTKLQWEHLEQPQIDGWLAWADELLALDSVRDALDAQEEHDRLREFAEWVLSIADDPPTRRTVTLEQIIRRAAVACDGDLAGES